MVIGLKDNPVQSTDITPFALTECAEMTDGNCTHTSCVTGYEYMIGIDLDSEKSVNKLYLDLDSGSAADYNNNGPVVRYSNDNYNWTEVSNLSKSNNTEGPCSNRSVLEFDSVVARYFRSHCSYRPYLTNIQALPAFSPIIFIFSDPSPVHLSTVYGNSQTLQLTVTVSGSAGSYVYDATFYNATTSGVIGYTVSGTSSGQSVFTNWDAIDGGDYFWYLYTTSSGSNDTSSTYEFTKKYKCEGYVEIDSTRTSGVPVRLYRRSNGELIGYTTSAGISGTFEIGTVYDENHYAVAIHPTDSGTNALIYDYLKPGE